ncbi:hypothetical protein KAI56_04015 [Candidatus Parcubacteria bacterium]|nr:hypothetical protein [Candidatus Parcubacteria bacterium]
MVNKKSNPKEKKSNLPKVNWQFVAESYLALAYSGIEKLKKYIHLTELEKEEWNKKESGWHRAYEAQLLLIPIVWNIKHALELTLKAHHVNFQGMYLEIHDLNDLKEELVNIFKIGKNNQDKKFDEFVKLVDKYYKMKMFDCELLSVSDFTNDFLRYPEGSKTAVQLNLYAFGKITEKEINQLIKDIKLIDLRLAIPADFQSLENAGLSQFANPYNKI